MSAHSAGRRAVVKAGYKPVHFSLDGSPLSCYFSGSVATTSGHFVHKSQRRTRDGGFHIPAATLETAQFFAHPHSQKPARFPAGQSERFRPAKPSFYPSAVTAGITHYTLQAKSCAKGGTPLETPDNKTGGTLPLHGAHTAFSFYPALRLYRLSKSQRGIDVVSLTK